MKMTNFKSLPKVFGILLGFFMVCLISFTSELMAQGTTYGLPPLKSIAEIDQIADNTIKFLQEDRKINCNVTDPTAPCAKRFQAVMESYMTLRDYIANQPNMTAYDLLRAIYPVSNMHSLATVPEAVNMDGFLDKRYNPYFQEILLALKQ